MSQIDSRDSRATLLMSVEELAGALRRSAAQPEGADGPVVVDCRFNLLKPDAGRAAWLEGHIPGAFYADLNRDLSSQPRPDSGRHPLPDPDQLRTLFGGFGIGPATQVVAYDEGGGSLAARLWWLLRWMGHRRVVLLDGGFAAWQGAGLPVDRAVPAARPRTFRGPARPNGRSRREPGGRRSGTATASGCWTCGPRSVSWGGWSPSTR